MGGKEILIVRVTQISNDHTTSSYQNIVLCIRVKQDTVNDLSTESDGMVQLHLLSCSHWLHGWNSCLGRLLRLHLSRIHYFSYSIQILNHLSWGMDYIFSKSNGFFGLIGIVLHPVLYKPQLTTTTTNIVLTGRIEHTGRISKII